MLVYKVMTLDEAEEYDRTREVPLSAADARDGYVHLSTREQLLDTLEKHFAEHCAVRLLAVAGDRLGQDLRWEPGREGALFPHLYGRLQAAHTIEGWLLARGLQGGFRLPREIDA